MRSAPKRKALAGTVAKVVSLSCMNRWSYWSAARRPVRRKADPDAGADCAAPAPLIRRRARENVAGRRGHTEPVAGHRAAALGVEQDVVEGIADLAGEQSERIDLRLVSEERHEQADV